MGPGSPLIPLIVGESPAGSLLLPPGADPGSVAGVPVEPPDADADGVEVTDGSEPSEEPGGSEEPDEPGVPVEPGEGEPSAPSDGGGSELPPPDTGEPPEPGTDAPSDPPGTPQPTPEAPSETPAPPCPTTRRPPGPPDAAATAPPGRSFARVLRAAAAPVPHRGAPRPAGLRRLRPRRRGVHLPGFAGDEEGRGERAGRSGAGVPRRVADGGRSSTLTTIRRAPTGRPPERSC